MFSTVVSVMKVMKSFSLSQHISNLSNLSQLDTGIVLVLCFRFEKKLIATKIFQRVSRLPYLTFFI